ncbi:MAG: FHA domain-containing protein [Acidobacteria bacterium]|nr:FHA domain-containing protein [Acidobacteriota bacterium]
MTDSKPDESTEANPPTAVLIATTKDARASLSGRREVRMSSFPFKVGRESRNSVVRQPVHTELRLGVAPQLNDEYLLEPSWADILHISREHFAIEWLGQKFFVVDRGSACGTIVAGTVVGGNRTGGRIELHSGDEILVGTNSSPYVFRFEIVEAS